MRQPRVRLGYLRALFFWCLFVCLFCFVLYVRLSFERVLFSAGLGRPVSANCHRTSKNVKIKLERDVRYCPQKQQKMDKLESFKNKETTPKSGFFPIQKELSNV